MSLLNNLRAPKGARKTKKRLGRGESSGLGKTSGRGHKGQKARAGGYHKVGFEGGQMPLARRLPKRGFTSIFKKEFAVINLRDLSRLPDSVTEVDAAVLIEAGIIKKVKDGVKVLGQGNIEKALKIKAKLFTKSAAEKIAQAGGEAVVE